MAVGPMSRFDTGWGRVRSGESRAAAPSSLRRVIIITPVGCPLRGNRLCVALSHGLAQVAPLHRRRRKSPRHERRNRLRGREGEVEDAQRSHLGPPASDRGGFIGAVIPHDEAPDHETRSRWAPRSGSDAISRRQRGRRRSLVSRYRRREVQRRNSVSTKMTSNESK